MERPILGDRYELGPVVGSGGFGTVFRARDRASGVDVAVKLVLPGLGSEVAAQRLRREATILRRVTSRHVARVLDAGDGEEGVWLVTELVEGAPLTVPTLGRPLLPHEVLRVARGLLEGLAAAHAAGIIHGDVKPSNVLVPFGDRALDGPKLVDFGLARVVARAEVAASIGAAMTRQGLVLGTARYMAPEVLSGSEPTARSDIYGAGLVLFELLDDGPLFPAGDGRAQLRARVAGDPALHERVAAPLGDVLARMLARDPVARYASAVEAHAAVADLDTAPVERVPDSSPPSVRRSLAPVAAHASSPPPSRGPASSMRPPSLPRPPSLRPPPMGAAPPPDDVRVARLTSLPADGIAALRETLRHLDLPMLDALARRERGHPIGRIARAVALALRLEIDAAALILEPLALQSDVARAIGAALLGPRARRVTRARVDGDRDDRWVDTIDPELAAMLVSLAASMTGEGDAARDADRCARALRRLEAKPDAALEVTRSTLIIALTAARVRRGDLDRAAGLDLIASTALGGPRVEAAFDVVVGALAGALVAETTRAGAALERAERIAAETGTTLLDAAAATALGRLLSSTTTDDDRALLALERASTLLAHGDAPSLEHEAEHHRAMALIALGRWADAAVHLRAAREAAHAERAGELEIVSASFSVFVELATGEIGVAYESAATLGESRLAGAGPRAAALAWSARAAAALCGSDHDGAEEALAEAKQRVRDAKEIPVDVLVLVESLGMLIDAVRGELPDPAAAVAVLERRAEERGFGAFYWSALLDAVVARVSDPIASRTMGDVLSRIDGAIGKESRLAHEVDA